MFACLCNRHLCSQGRGCGRGLFGDDLHFQQRRRRSCAHAERRCATRTDVSSCRLAGLEEEKHLKLRIEFDDLDRLLEVPRNGPGLDPDIFGAIWLDSGRIVIDESLDPRSTPRWKGAIVSPLRKMRGDFDRSNKTVAFTRDRAGAGPQAPRRASGPTQRDWKGGNDDRNERSHLAVIERVVLAAFPKDPAARKRVLDAARERMAHHRRRGARFDRAEIVEGKTKLSREASSKSAERTRDADRAERGRRNR